ncbi:MAG TPA: hypothetical protein VFZ22_07540 [Pyrinomonadaceae bacterium]|nr:hypothetical protein [Pyrinomonadaceae bacterium]
MITGFNTDIEHDGVVYHVQTEDKGLDSPIILSLVYSGGTILASKRSPYKDLIAEGFSDEALAERLKRQHKLICAAIHSGRINDLKKMSGRAKEPAATAHETVVETEDAIEEVTEVETAQAESTEQPFEIEYWPLTQQWTPPPPKEEVETVEETAAEEEGGEQVSEPYFEEEEAAEVLPDGLVITLLDDEEEFFSGNTYTLRVHISNRVNGDETPLAGAAISIKILGTTFRPLIYSLKTESDGVATVSTEIPHFTSGRAAVLVRVVVKDQAAELRRIIHPAE